MQFGIIHSSTIQFHVQIATRPILQRPLPKVVAANLNMSGSPQKEHVITDNYLTVNVKGHLHMWPMKVQKAESSGSDVWLQASVGNPTRCHAMLLSFSILPLDFIPVL